MGNLNGRVARLEAQTRPERPIVIIGRDMVWDVVAGEQFSGDVEEAEVMARYDVDLEAFL